MANFAVLGALALAVYIVVQHVLPHKRQARSLPPGPKPLPLVGNIRDLAPKGTAEHYHWRKHRELYGPVSSITILGQVVVFLHEAEAAHTFLGKQTSISSNRPSLEFSCKLCGYDETLPLMPFGSKFARNRKLILRQMGTKGAVAQFDDAVDVGVRRLMLRILKEPQNTVRNFYRQFGATVLQMTYGYAIEPTKPDPLIRMIERFLHNSSRASIPLTWAVDLVPALKYLPDGFPFTGFRRLAKAWRKQRRVTAEVPYEFVRKQMRNGCAGPSYVASVVRECIGEAGKQDPVLSHEDEEMIKWSATSMYAAGTDTSAVTATSFLLGMVRFPEVQRKAQEEIERLVGTDRLPRCSDRSKLPYVEGILKESYRWAPAGPFGIPHVMTEDAVYDGHLIPKGALVRACIWDMLNNPAVYANPDEFDPDRYSEPRSEPDPRAEVFGFGRRRCPGRFFADSSVFMVIAQTLAAFNIRKAVDEEGRELEAELKILPGTPSKLADFPYRIEPRSEELARLVERVEIDHPSEDGQSSLLEGVDLS